MTDKQKDKPIEYQDGAAAGSNKWPEDAPTEKHATVDRKIDSTLEDSFPASDPPSSIPAPEDEEAA